MDYSVFFFHHFCMFLWCSSHIGLQVSWQTFRRTDVLDGIGTLSGDLSTARRWASTIGVEEHPFQLWPCISACPQLQSVFQGPGSGSGPSEDKGSVCSGAFFFCRSTFFFWVAQYLSGFAHWRVSAVCSLSTSLCASQEVCISTGSNPGYCPRVENVLPCNIRSGGFSQGHLATPWFAFAFGSCKKWLPPLWWFPSSFSFQAFAAECATGMG